MTAYKTPVDLSNTLRYKYQIYAMGFDEFYLNRWGGQLPELDLCESAAMMEIEEFLGPIEDVIAK